LRNGVSTSAVRWRVYESITVKY